jgi:hypothetical protein
VGELTLRHIEVRKTPIAFKTGKTERPGCALSGAIANFRKISGHHQPRFRTTVVPSGKNNVARADR